MSRADRLMADVARLAVACAWWQFSGASRPLSVDSPAGDERADDEWNAARDVEHMEAIRLLGLVRDQRAALALLGERTPRGARARAHARHAVRRAVGSVPIRVVHGFGQDWRELPTAPLSLRDQLPGGVVLGGRRGGQ